MVRDLPRFGGAMKASFDAQLRMFPRMMTSSVAEAISALPLNIAGYKLAGAGGGGYLIIAADAAPEDCARIRVRHAST
jgi:galactokinase/mevalonate kinase-like predicted kinase